MSCTARTAIARPGPATYRIEVAEVPEGYNAPPSLLVPPRGDSLSVAACPGDPDPDEPCVVHTDAEPPSGGTNADYYLAWVMADGDGTAVHNHVPLDPAGAVVPDSLVTVTKRATVKSVNVGDVVGYVVRVTNPSTHSLDNLQLVDDIPSGFALVADSVSVRSPGTDGVLGTGDDRGTPLAAKGSDPVSFEGLSLPANASLAVSYLTRVTTGASAGEHVNSVKPYLSGQLAGNEATASVDVIADPVFEKTTVIGKVFDDRNGDGRQGPDEPGIAGVRLATVSGLIVETDAHGRYHLADIDAGDPHRGRNFIVKLDTATLPGEAVVTSENPRVIRLTPALMSKVNFGVRMPSRHLEPEPGPRRQQADSRGPFTSIRSHRTGALRIGKIQYPASYIDRLRTLLARYPRQTQPARAVFGPHRQRAARSANAADLRRQSGSVRSTRPRGRRIRCGRTGPAQGCDRNGRSCRAPVGGIEPHRRGHGIESPRRNGIDLR